MLTMKSTFKCHLNTLLGRKMQYRSKYLDLLLSPIIGSNIRQNFSSNKPTIILGIETSCDDTGCGIVDNNRNILGEAIHSQQQVTVKYGGVIPNFASKMHQQNITNVCESALRSANLKLRDIDGIATTVKPGLPLSLQIGKRFGTYLSIIGNKPFIPIHHMEAHALTVRLVEKVDFPYLVLLMSGGHCLLAVVQNVDTFYLLGSHLDHAPGELLDKIARKLKLQNIPEFSNMSGGKAIEMAARKTSNLRRIISFPNVTLRNTCKFSFSGFFTKYMKYIIDQEKLYNIAADMIIPDIYNLCADIQLNIVEQLCNKVQRAIEFLNYIDLIPSDKRTLVISGGVASNNFIADTLSKLCSELNYKLVRTPPKLCTDNGVMIAWNGMEKWIANTGIITNKDEIINVPVMNKCPLGEDWSEKVSTVNLKYNKAEIIKKLHT